MNRRTAKIENWLVAPAEDGGFVLKGNVTEHAGNPEPGPDGFHSTSRLTTIDLEKGIAYSANTDYTLVGNPQVPAL